MRFSTAMSAFCIASSRAASVLSTSCWIACDGTSVCAFAIPGHTSVISPIVRKMYPADINIVSNRAAVLISLVSDQSSLVSYQAPLPLHFDEDAGKASRPLVHHTVVFDHGFGPPAHYHRVAINAERVIIGLNRQEL